MTGRPSLLRRIIRPGPHLYLASREDMFHVRRLLQEIPVHKGGTYIGIIGGLGTLNYLTEISPDRIILVDLNPDQVDYARCFLELIGLARSREEFAECFFSRKYMADEVEFLRQDGDPVVFDRTLEKMRNREAFGRFFSVIRDAAFDGDGLRIVGNDYCRCLRLGGPSRGTPRGFNFLYFGQGWLKNNSSFARLRSIVRRARWTFVTCSIDKFAPDLAGSVFYFHGSNVLDSSPKPYHLFLSRFQDKLAKLDRDVAFVHFSTYHEVNRTTFKRFRSKGRDVHTDCAAKVAEHTRGKDVLELVPGEHCFGRELRAESVEVKSFRRFKFKRRYDAVVSHILYGSRLLWLSRRGFEKALKALLASTPELVVVEHNSESLDFKSRHLLRFRDLAGFLNKYQGTDIQVEFSKGLRDNRRNMIVRVKLREDSAPRPVPARSLRSLFLRIPSGKLNPLERGMRRVRLLAVTMVRNEARFLPGMLRNVGPQVDGIIALDDGSTDGSRRLLEKCPLVVELLRNPPGRRGWDLPGNNRRLIAAALRHNAQWIIALDADERLEREFRKRAERVIGRGRLIGLRAFAVHVRELWDSRHQYRADGIWGQKSPPRLFKALADHRFDDRPLHTARAPLQGKVLGLFPLADLFLYHLRMVNRADREERRRRNEQLDPKARCQPRMGYAYLTDERGLELRAVPEERGYDE
jgi:hypothetical protein